tara:strand:+ start:2453 stop:3094 length:642 start_codon:yes stop_codon:yes gene_type:complete
MITNKIIEFIGMPGSGKTFYENKIIKLGKKKIIKNNFNYLNKLQKTKFIILFIFSYPIFFFKSFNLILKNILKKKEFRKYSYYFYNEIAYRSYFEFKIKDKIILLNSEGFVYRASNYFNYIFNKKTEKYLNCLPKVDLIIFVKSYKKTNLLRTKKRKIGYKYNEKDLKDYYKKTNFLKKVCNFLKKKKIKIIFINNFNNNNYRKNLKKIIKYI